MLMQRSRTLTCVISTLSGLGEARLCLIHFEVWSKMLETVPLSSAFICSCSSAPQVPSMHPGTWLPPTGSILLLGRPCGPWAKDVSIAGSPWRQQGLPYLLFKANLSKIGCGQTTRAAYFAVFMQGLLLSKAGSQHHKPSWEQNVVWKRKYVCFTQTKGLQRTSQAWTQLYH